MGVLSRILSAVRSGPARAGRRVSEAARQGTRRATRDVGRGVGLGAEDLAPDIEGVDDATASKILAGTLADQPSRAVGRTASSAENVLTSTQKSVVGLAGIGGAAFVGNEYFQAKKEEAKAIAKDNQNEAIQAIRNDPNLSAEQKERMIEQLVNAGFFDPPGGDNSENGPLGFLSTLFADRSIPELGAIFLVLFFAGRALTESVGGGAGQ